MNAMHTISPQARLVERPESDILRAYIERTPASSDAYKKLIKHVAGGNSRMTSYWMPYPLTVTRGKAHCIWDADGNQYIDLINNFTSLIHGHAYSAISDVVSQQLPHGTAWAANCPSQLELAEVICSRIPSADKVRFANSGTEAGILALMVARAVTGRDKILMAKGGYHGCLNDFIRGTFGACEEQTLVADFNDLSDFERVLAEEGKNIAAVFVEPLLSGSGGIVADFDFLSGLMKATQNAGALFVLDEVQTFRLSTGGKQLTLGLEPDLTMLGKLIGGGFPVGALAGKDEYMSVFDPDNLRAFHGGTFNANPITMAAGVVAVNDLTEQEINRLDNLGEKLANGLKSAAADAGIPFSLNRSGSLINLFFLASAPAPGIGRSDQEMLNRFHLACMNQGLFIANRGYIALSTPMNEEIIDNTIEKFSLALNCLAEEILTQD